MAKSFQFDVPKEAKGKKLEEEFLSTAQTILKEQTVLRLYKNKKISTGIAAKMLSMPLQDFMCFAAQHRTSVFPEYTRGEPPRRGLRKVPSSAPPGGVPTRPRRRIRRERIDRHPDRVSFL